MTHLTMLDGDSPAGTVNKWDILRELTAARTAFGLSDRDMSVLQALLSFHPGTELGEAPEKLVVFPSNASICERLNGMPSSTMRRHLGRLVNSGVILRRDSPNGKRYSRSFGGRRIAYGFDLRPLILRQREITEAAQDIRDRDLRIAQLRETVSLMRRDLAGLAEFGASVQPGLGFWDACSDIARLVARALRRNLGETELEHLHDRLQSELLTAKRLLEPAESEEMSTNDAQNEQHHQSSEKELIESEPTIGSENAVVAIQNTDDGEIGTDRLCNETRKPSKAPPSDRTPHLPLRLVLSTCSEIQTYLSDPVRDWHDLVRLADMVRPMMGITSDVWEDAKSKMGVVDASIVLAAMLERFSKIRSAGAYLRALITRSAEGAFSSGPMIMALVRRQAA